MKRAHEESAPIRAAVYCRTAVAGRDATARGDDARLAAQEAACRDYATARGWTVVGVHAEVAPGTAAAARPALDRLRAAMLRGEVDVLLVDTVDRLSRDHAHLGRLLAEAEGAGVRWVSVAEGADDSPLGLVLRAVLGGGRGPAHRGQLPRPASGDSGPISNGGAMEGRA